MSFYDEVEKSFVVYVLPKKYTEEEISELFEQVSLGDKVPSKMSYLLYYLHEHCKNLDKNNEDE